MTHADPDHWPMSETADLQARFDTLMEKRLESLQDYHDANRALYSLAKDALTERDLFRNRATASAAVVEAARLATAEFRASPVDELGLAVRLTRLFNALDRLPKESA